MHGSLEPEDRVMDAPSVYEQVASLVQRYGWEAGDNIVVEMAGTQVSGIDVGEVYNKKWQSPIGTRKYNKDCFIVIKNQSRRDLTKSQPLDREHKPRHPYTPVEPKDIVVNTIYCGDYDQGVREFWYDGAKLGKGEYFNINSNKAIVHISTPYDDNINAYNDSLNRTYYGYGSSGNTRKLAQVSEDANAEAQSVSVKAERSIAKSKANYSNGSWDLIDAVENEGKDINSINEQDLPKEFQGKTEEEKKKLIEEKKAEREMFQKKINELAVERQKYIEEKKKEENPGEDDFGSSVRKSIEKKATELGYEKETTP